ncbi:restriction modification system DNA specificitydomain [groundwater metagenome]
MNNTNQGIMTLLGEHIQTQKGFAFKSQWYSDCGTPIVKVSEFTDDSIDTLNLTCIPDDIAVSYMKYKLRTGDTIIQTVGSWPRNPNSVVGKVIKVPSKASGALLNQNAVKISPAKTLDRSFIFYLLKSNIFKDFIIGCAQGAANQASITLDDIRNFSFWLPPLPTQRKIASILSAYDDLIENNTRRIKILEEMAQALYREWFVKFRFPGHEKVGMVESELGMVPEGWEVKRLGDVVTLHRGKSYRTPDLVDEGRIPFLNLKCIERGGGFRYDGVKRFQGEYKPTQTAKTGDIIVAVTDMTQERRLVAHAARVHIIGNDFAVMSMDLVKIEPIKEGSKDYLHGVLRFSDFSQEVRQHANGVNVLHLNPSQIQEFKFALPPTELRNLYAELCASAYQECDVLHTKNANLRRTRDLLLPKLISGEVDVEMLDINIPTEAL